MKLRDGYKCLSNDNHNLNTIVRPASLVSGYKNGKATLQTDTDLLKHFDTLNNKPKLVIKVIVESAYIHCPKTLMRSKFWSIEHHQNMDVMPTIGQIISDQTKCSAPVESREEMLERYTPDL